MPADKIEFWGILELMGHRQRAGFITEVEVAGGKMLRVDIPIDTEESITEFYGTASVYAMRPCAEDVARDVAARHGDPRPISPVAYRLSAPDDDDEGRVF